jgi:hypothetical protein
MWITAIIFVPPIVITMTSLWSEVGDRVGNSWLGLWLQNACAREST